jgi:hypothetical protein
LCREDRRGWFSHHHACRRCRRRSGVDVPAAARPRPVFYRFQATVCIASFGLTWFYPVKLHVAVQLQYVLIARIWTVVQYLRRWWLKIPKGP